MEKNKRENFVWKVGFSDALNWELSSESLGCALVDEAQRDAPEHIRDNEGDTDISVVDNEFVVTLFVEREG